MIAIYKRELKSYFHSMVGYAFIAFLLGFMGLYFTVYNLNYGYPMFSVALASTMFIFLIAVPILTMKSFAEERKSKTDQLLLTAPVKVVEIVMGKYLAMLTVFAIPVLVSCVFPFLIKMQGTAYLKLDYAAILMFFVIGSVYIAIGMFLSALTESQIIAVVSTFATLLLLYLWNGIIEFLPAKAGFNMLGLLIIIGIVSMIIYSATKNWVISAGLAIVGIIGSLVTFLIKSELFEGLLKNILSKFAFASILNNVIDNSVFDVSSLILCLSLVFLFVFLTIQTIQKRRWS